MVWSIKKYLIALFLLQFLTGCEVYHRYFIINYIDTVHIGVKVDNTYHLPIGYIPLNTGQYKNSSGYCNTEYFTKKLSITIDSTNSMYSFTQPPGSAVWLQPSKAGPPAIQYIIVNKDTVAIADSKLSKNNHLKFYSSTGQKFILERY